MLKVLVLGPLRVEGDDGLIPVVSLTQQRLLARLAVGSRSGVATEVLCEDLHLSVAALRTAIWRLRKTLGDVVITNRSGYALADVEFDYERFERDIAGASAVDGVNRIAVIDQSLAYWRGSALDRFGSEPWAQPLAVRLEELRANAQESTAEAKLGLGHHLEVIAEMQSLIADYPLRDRPRGLLMEALAGAGRRTEALRVFNEYRTLLMDQVGTEPGNDLRRVDANLAAGADEAETLEAAQRDERGDGSVGRRAGDLPRTSTTLVGRRDDLEAVAVHMRASRIVTITGVGGVGKTRLAAEVGRDLHRGWIAGVRFADLTRAGRGGDVVAVVQDALGVSSAGGLSMDGLVQLIVADDLLLVLDNCEHVIAEVAALVELIESSCPGIAMLATSREALGVPGERVYVLAPLSASGDAVELFADRARAVDRSFRLDDSTGPVVQEICHTLDGIPLAVELAAARLRSLGVQDVADRLDDRFRLLSGVRRTAVDRHRTLTAALDWSFDLLSEAEQRALLWLATFVQAFSLSDAEGLLEGTASVDTIAALVDKSMLSRGDGTYRLLETIRQYCLDRLAQRGELDDARADHAAHILAETRLAVARVHGAESISGASRVRVLFAELRAGAQWAAETDRLDLVMDLCEAVESVFVLDLDFGALAADVRAQLADRQQPRSLLLEGFVLLDLQLKGGPPPVDHVRQLIDRFLAGEPSSTVAAFGPMALSYHGHYAEAVVAAERVRSHCRRLPDGPTPRYSLQASGYLTGKPEYIAELQQGLAVARDERSDYWIGSIGICLAHVMADIDPAEAREIVLSCIGSALDVGMPLLVQTSLLLYILLVVLDDTPHPLEQRVSTVLVQEIAQARLGYRLRGHHFLVLGALLAVTGEYHLAAQALGACDTLATPSSTRTQALSVAVRTNIEARLAEAGVDPAPPPTPAELPGLASRIEGALSLQHDNLPPQG